MPTESEIEAKAREIYLALYEEMGGRWGLVETKNVWREKARQWFALDEGTRAGVQRDPVCDHIPMKAALDNEIGCIRCGQWLGKVQ